MVDDKPSGAVFVKEMGLDHAEFFRTLPKALGTADYEVSGNTVRMADGVRRLDITLAPEGRRTIALLSLPVTRVTLAFHGYSDADVAAALEHFDMHFHRGGG